MSPEVWDFTVTHVTGTEQMSLAGRQGVSTNQRIAHGPHPHSTGRANRVALASVGIAHRQRQSDRTDTRQSDRTDKDQDRTDKR